jgi:peptidoglycan/xylan/chitin deacetylase (PgdA/CDA1 family)
MKVYLSFDYELFFGAKSGSANQCIIEPTDQLLKIAAKHGIRMNFFVDGGYLLALEKYAKRHSSVAYEKQQVYRQLQQLTEAGHDCQLHIHPHWEDSYYDGNDWKMNTDRYRLDHFSDEQIQEIIQSYFAITKEICGKAPIAFRAGGWCLPPWGKVADTFKKLGVWIDSTVYEKGFQEEGQIKFDFRNAPALDQWLFDTDPLVQDPIGYFLELPISSVRFSPLFFWNLYIRGRLNRSLHTSMGDGIPMAQPGTKKKVLTGYSQQALSCDGYYASIMKEEFNRRTKRGDDTMVVIGHPKAQSKFSLQELDEFILTVKDSCTFARYSDLQQD